MDWTSIQEVERFQAGFSPANQTGIMEVIAIAAHIGLAYAVYHGKDVPGREYAWLDADGEDITPSFDLEEEIPAP